MIGNLHDSVVFLLEIGLYVVLIWYLYPVSAVILLLGGLWFPCLLSLLKIYPIIETTFDIESRIKEKQSSSK